MKSLLKRPLTWFLIIGIGVFVWFFVLPDDSEPPYESTVIERGILAQEVIVTGHVKPSEDVSLTFEQSGKISSINVRVGDIVESGDVLARLSSEDLLAELREAEATLRVEQAKLEELESGSTQEELAVQRTRVQNAREAVNDSIQNLIEKLEDAYTKSDDAVRNKTDGLFDNAKTTSPNFKYAISDNQLESDIENGRRNSELLLVSWRNSLNSLTPSSNVMTYAEEAEDNLNDIKVFMNNMALAVNALRTNSSLSQATIDGYKSDISTARTNVNTAITNLNSATEELADARNNLKLEEQELALDEAGTREEQIRAQEAQIERARAAISTRRAAFEKTTIRAPFSGIITKRNNDVGEVVSATTPVLSLISDTGFEVEAFPSEIDIVKISLGDSAELTLDAYGEDEIIEAKVVSIDPAETIIEGVVTYKTILQFVSDVSDLTIKSGMTANLNIFTARKDDVLAVPARSIIREGDQKYVRVVRNGNIQEVPVETGLRGSDGRVEIVEGLGDGDEVITFLDE